MQSASVPAGRISRLQSGASTEPSPQSSSDAGKTAPDTQQKLRKSLTMRGAFRSAVRQGAITPMPSTAETVSQKEAEPMT